MTLVVLVGGLALFVWSGVYNVAATEPHFDLTKWIFASTRDQSIKNYSGGVMPSEWDKAELIKKGLKSYHSMCIVCHSAPGKDPTVIQQGLNPKPPKLEKPRVQNRTDEEIFWIVKHGIKMTGMPAFGPTQ